MTPKQIIDGNEMIAEFMGYKSYTFRKYKMFVLEDNNHIDFIKMWTGKLLKLIHHIGR